MEINKKLYSKGISRVYKKEKLFFDLDEIEYYKKTFNELINKKFIIADSFDSEQWTIPDFMNNNFRNIRFNLDVFQEIQTGLKIYTTLLIYKGRSSSSIKATISSLKTIILASNGFKNVEAISSLFNSLKSPYFFSSNLRKFIDFYPLINHDDILKLCTKIHENQRINRKLPPFYEIFIFDEIINDYFNTKEGSLNLLYKPIQLWWQITTILPMRPNDFLRIKTNCIKKESNGTYWITIPRSKIKKDSIDDEYPTQTFQITKHIYELILDVKNQVQQLVGVTEYLIPQTLLSSGKLLFPNTNRKVIENRLVLEQFHSILNRFTTEIVQGLYSELNLSKFLPIHTRHIAIINLFLQGFNLISIAHMSGHSEINSPSNYYSHAENFVDSYIYSLVNMGLSDNISKNMSGSFIGWRRDAFDRGKLYEDVELENKYSRVDFGYCGDNENFPFNCTDCRSCNFYIFKPSLNEYEEGINWLESYSHKLSEQIYETIRSMITINSTTKIAIDSVIDSELKSHSRELQKFMDLRVSVEIKLQEEINNND